MVILIVILFVSIDMIEITNAIHYIGYGPLKRNRNLGCSPTHPKLCKLVPANPYDRGCSPINRCRGGNNIIDNKARDGTMRVAQI